MNKSITQATQNDKQISKSIKRFFTRFHVSSALKASNAYKKKGIPAMEIFQYLFLLIFSNRSMYMNLITGRNTPDFAKDTVYRFMKLVQTNWIRFTTILSSRIIRDAILPLDSKDRANVLIIDDSMLERNRSKKVELLAKVYDHNKYINGMGDFWNGKEVKLVRFELGNDQKYYANILKESHLSMLYEVSIIEVTA